MDGASSPSVVEARIFEILASFGAEPDALNRDATFKQLDIDSLDLVELAQIVDDEFEVQVTTNDAEHLQTVGDAIDLIASRVP